MIRETISQWNLVGLWCRQPGHFYCSSCLPNIDCGLQDTAVDHSSTWRHSRMWWG